MPSNEVREESSEIQPFRVLARDLAEELSAEEVQKIGGGASAATISATFKHTIGDGTKGDADGD